MEVFWYLFAYLIVVDALFNYKATKKRRLYSTILMWLGLSTVLGLRSPQCGIDLKGSYFSYFSDFANMSWGEVLSWIGGYLEPGFIIYGKLLAIIWGEPHFSVAITAFITIGLISFVIYKYSNNILLSFIIFSCLGLYIFSFSGIRQALAFSMTFFSFHFIVKGNKKAFFLTALLATSIHYSSFVFLFVWPLWNIKITRSKSLLSLAILMFIIPFLGIIVSAITPYLFGGRYNDYQDKGGATTMFFVYVLLFLFSVFFKPMFKDTVQNVTIKLKEHNFYKWMILFSVVFQATGFISAGSMTRITYYFSIFFCLYLPNIIMTFPKQSRGVMRIILIFLLIFFFYLVVKDGFMDVVPYHFFWEPGYFMA